MAGKFFLAIGTEHVYILKPSLVGIWVFVPANWSCAWREAYSYSRYDDVTAENITPLMDDL